MTLRDALHRCLDWLANEAPDAVSARLLDRRCLDWQFEAESLWAPASDAADLRVWLSPARRILYVRLREPGDASAELRVKLPRDLVREIAA